MRNRMSGSRRGLFDVDHDSAGSCAITITTNQRRHKGDASKLALGPIGDFQSMFDGDFCIFLALW